jgi:hypothetical protein
MQKTLIIPAITIPNTPYLMCLIFGIAVAIIIIVLKKLFYKKYF